MKSKSKVSTAFKNRLVVATVTVTLGAAAIFLVTSPHAARILFGGALELRRPVDFDAVGQSASANVRIRPPPEVQADEGLLPGGGTGGGAGGVLAAGRAVQATVGAATLPDPTLAVMAMTTMEMVEAEANASGGWEPLRPACYPDCSCDEISAHWGAFHDAMDFFATPEDMIKRWLALKCQTSPPVITDRLTLRIFQAAAAPPLSDAGVCYFVKVRGGNPHADPTEAKAGRAVPLAGWAAAVANRTWFVEDGHVGSAAGAGGQGSTVDMATMTIRLAIPHPTSAMDLSKKTMALFDFLSQTHDIFWGPLGCRWFAHVDDDTWVNTELAERRIGCLDHDSEVYLGYDIGVAFGGFYVMSRAVIRQTAGFLATWWRRRRGRPITMKMDEFNWGHMLKMHGVTVSSMVHLEHYLLDPGRCKNKKIEGGYNDTCALDWIRAQMLAPHATDPNTKDGHDGGFPMQRNQDAHGASRCLLFIHGFKTVIAMHAAHTAMTSIMSHRPPIDYRLARWQHLPVADPLCVGGIRSGSGSHDIEHLFQACASAEAKTAGARQYQA